MTHTITLTLTDDFKEELRLAMNNIKTLLGDAQVPSRIDVDADQVSVFLMKMLKTFNEQMSTITRP